MFQLLPSHSQDQYLFSYFQIIDDLQDRLEAASNFTPPLEGANFRYGFNSEFLKKILNYWRDEYNWPKREIYLNSLPQFKTKIYGLDVHFIHAKPEVKSSSVRVIPILLMHGWPGSVREYYELIPKLTKEQEGRDFVFEVICPSLPGYGFSEGAHKPGLGCAEIAVMMRTLMRRLGFEKFYVNGGDWGGIIANYMATLYPQK